MGLSKTADKIRGASGKVADAFMNFGNFLGKIQAGLEMIEKLHALETRASESATALPVGSPERLYCEGRASAFMEARQLVIEQAMAEHGGV